MAKYSWTTGYSCNSSRNRSLLMKVPWLSERIVNGTPLAAASLLRQSEKDRVDSSVTDSR